jgi:RNA polymerase nonessential primary-like sigma factor
LKKDSDKSLVECLSEEDKPSLPDMLQNERISTGINEWLNQLSDKQREVVCHRYGLRNYEQATLEEVAAVMGVTRERVRQIQMEALRRMREILETEGYTSEVVFG